MKLFAAYDIKFPMLRDSASPSVLQFPIQKVHLIVPIGFQDFSYLRLDEQIFSLGLYEPGTHGPLSRTTNDGARDHIELAAVARARHSHTIQLALRERAPHMGARVIEGMQLSECPCDAHLGSRDIEDAHLVRNDILCVTNTYHHDLTSLTAAAARFATAIRG